MAQSKIKCLVVDDEPLAAKVIESYLKKLDGFELAAKCSNAVEAFNQLNSNNIDLIFLDIKMPQITGMDLIRSLTNPPKIILTTAYREYAVESYEHDVVDYLLKPISFERFLKAVSKITNTISNTTGSITPKENEPEYIFVKSNKKQVKVALDEILYIEGLKEYLRIVTSNEKIISYLSLTYMEEKLPSSQFVRVHRSYIVSIDKIRSYTSTELTLTDKTIPIGRHYKQRTLKMLQKD